MKTKYILGFAFTEDYRDVLLIRKNRPDWQEGKLNGIGGHLEDNESPLQAIVREFEEETGVKTTVGQWCHYASNYFEHAEVEIFWLVDNAIRKYDTKTDETVMLLPVKDVISDCFDPEIVDGVSLLINLARMHQRYPMAPTEFYYNY